jgi:hypothetical protein
MLQVGGPIGLRSTTCGAFLTSGTLAALTRPPALHGGGTTPTGQWRFPEAHFKDCVTEDVPSVARVPPRRAGHAAITLIDQKSAE